MTTDEFIKDIEISCNLIVYISAKHILNKLNIKNINKKEIKDIFSNYNNYIIYLNDIAGQIYRRHNSSTEFIYKELCIHLNIEWDNKSLYESRLKKLNHIDDCVLDELDDDIKDSVMKKLNQQKTEIENSRYYETIKN
ncbi:MAG: hypothetical protein DRG11_02330 [Epsilonproteobacteria bacterium]|nr:MAG: hypothetical protein DRG11_02330 [Campylobacterota bacterium]